MIPFHTDPHWYEEHWYGSPPDENEVEAPLRLGSGRFARIAVCLTLLAAIPLVSYLGFKAAARSPSPYESSWQN